MAPRRLRLLTIAHSYCVDVNRRLAHELASSGEWDVTAVGPARFRGDFSWHTTERRDFERCAVVPVPVRFGRRVHTMIYGRALTKLLQEPWDLVHCWEEPYVASAAQVALATPRTTPLVYATFQNIAKRYPPPLSYFERYSLARASGVVAFGKTVFDVIAPRTPEGVPVRVITPGVDTTQFAASMNLRTEVRRALTWTGDDAPVFGFLGRFVAEKGCRLLMQALDSLEVLQRPWRALFVGGGDLEGELRHWSQRYRGRVAIITGVPHADVPSYLNVMDVLCAPSLTTPSWREQFGRMVIEAFACGIPVVASDSGEIPYVVGDAGIVLPEGDLPRWSSALAELLGDGARRAELGRLGRARAVDRFAWPVIAQQHLDFFDDLLAGRSRGQQRTVVQMQEFRESRPSVTPERVA